MDEHNWEKVQEPDDPRRCQAVTDSRGQCWNMSMEGQTCCPCHGGTANKAKAEKKQADMYRIAKYQQRLAEFAEHDKIKSLRDEIGLLRILIEERWNQCKQPLDILLHSTVLADMLMKVEKLVTSCNRLEGQLGTMLDKTQAMQLGQEIVEIVARHVENEDTLSQIAEEIIDSIARLGKPKAG